MKVTDPLGNVTRYEYDQLDRTVAERVERNGESLVTQYQFDGVGNLLQVTDRLGRVRKMDYDALGRLTDEVWYATIAESKSPDEEILYADIDLERARNKHYIRVPGKHEINRMADRRPEMYGPITEPHDLLPPGRSSR